MGRIENEEYKIDKERKRRNRERLKNDIKVDLKKEIEYDLLSEFRIKFKQEIKEELKKELKDEIKKEIILELKIENIRTKEIQDKIGSKNKKVKHSETLKKNNYENINIKKENYTDKIKEEPKDKDEKLISDFLGFRSKNKDSNKNNQKKYKDIEETEVMSENEVTAYMDRTAYLEEIENEDKEEDYFLEDSNNEDNYRNIITENIKKGYEMSLDELKRFKENKTYNKYMDKLKNIRNSEK